MRRELRWVLIDKRYGFETNAGTKTLADLFDGRSQLLDRAPKGRDEEALLQGRRAALRERTKEGPVSGAFVK